MTVQDSLAGRQSLWSYFLLFVFASLGLLGGALWYVTTIFQSFYIEQLTSDLTDRGRFFISRLKSEDDISDSGRIQSLCEELGRATETRFTFIDLAGVVRCDSHANPVDMDNHLNRPEVQEALKVGLASTELRLSNTLKERHLYVAMPYTQNGKTISIVRTAFPVPSFQEKLRGVYVEIFVVALLTIGFLFVLSIFFYRRFNTPLQEIQRVAERFADGEIEHRIPRYGIVEIDDLAGALNRTAMRLYRIIDDLREQRKKQDAIFSSMEEGVIVLDPDRRIMNINVAARRFIGAEQADVFGEEPKNVVTRSGFSVFLELLELRDDPFEIEIRIVDKTTQWLSVHVSPIRDESETEFGLLVVLSDITRLKQLEKVRSDFVANVSHELKTPITSIKGFVETLLDGAKDSPQDLQRFLDIILAQSERMRSIVEDLLTLARLEGERVEDLLVLQRTKVSDIFGSASSICQVRAQEKDIALSVECSEEDEVEVDRSLIEQALINLVDNAIKYSDPGSRIFLQSNTNGRQVTLSVRDEGPGIARKELPRLFERFYRVDKARSRKLGGTGLGLAIVKHIASVHNGSVSVESKLGEGASFAIHLDKPT